MARSPLTGSTSRKRLLPVAEPTYPPPRQGPSPAAVAAGVAVTVFAVVLGVAAVLMRGGGKPARPGEPHPQFAPLVDEYYGRAIEGPGGRAWYQRLADVASLEAGRFGVAQRPRVGPDPPIRILGVQRRRVSRTLTGGADRDLLFVAYEADPAANLPRTRGPEAALAFVRSGYDAYPEDAVLLLYWTPGEPAGQVRLQVVDFPAHVSVGVALAVVEPPARGAPEGAVAFALGDPLHGDGRLVSEWMPVSAGP